MVVAAVVAAGLVVALALVGSLGSQARPDPTVGVSDGAMVGDVAGAPTRVRDSESADVARTAEQASSPAPVAESLVSQVGTGEVSVVRGSTPAALTDPSTRVVRYRVMVEDGLSVAGEPVDGAEIAGQVHSVLTDSRGWGPIAGVAFQRVSSGSHDVDVVLASPDTTDDLCAPLGTDGWLSCFNGNAAVLNARRWFSGAETYGRDLVDYRSYLVSHEIGHYLGHQHQGCPAPGSVAPVMVQQTKSLDGCRQGPWPSGG